MQQLSSAVMDTTTTTLSLTFVLLLLAHLLGDFILQPGRWVRQKNRLGYKSTAFWWHILLHGGLSWLLIARCAFWPFALLLTILHGAIDQLKSEQERIIALKGRSGNDKRRWFWYDQLLHLFSLILITILWQATSYGGGDFYEIFQTIKADFVAWWTLPHILLITLVLFLTSPSAIIIRTLITGWTPAYNNQLETDSLKNAGTYIGMLERLFVFIFIICGQFEAVGFLLAAKSIFRFGDLKAAKDRKLTEYVLIGTLLSFGLAVTCALIYLHGNLVG